MGTVQGDVFFTGGANAPSTKSRRSPHGPLANGPGLMTATGTPYAVRDAASYWEPVWRQGRRYRGIDAAEAGAMHRHLGAGRGRPALDIGCGDGALTAHLARLGYHSTGIDCAPTAVAAARARHPQLDLRVLDFDSADTDSLPRSAYAVVACRLVYRWAADKPGFLSRVRRILAPGGVFWVVTSLHTEGQGPPRPWEATAADVELLTAQWSRVRVVELDPSFRCYALRP
ncbi:class I SAM-dependent methyltransferase [Streptomyces sp. NPDC018947]|uniref:class I SAM-dependent methyltransferase n=1 Tax=Streptomyces sp. NPDC018947 TaxID=3365054 RepID=UPI003791E526